MARRHIIITIIIINGGVGSVGDDGDYKPFDVFLFSV